MRSVIALGIFLAHVLALNLIFRASRIQRETWSPPEFSTTARIIVQPEKADTAPEPLIQLGDPPEIELGLREIRFADSIEDELAGVISASSAPRLSKYQSVDVSTFARRAHVAPGRPRTVILIVGVQQDGLASSVDIASSSGDSSADRAAVDYALALRWVPATRDRLPIKARILFPVTLVAPS